MSNDQSAPEAKEYNRIKNFLFISHTVLTIGMLLVISVLGLSIFLRAYLRLTIDNPLVLNGAFFLLLYVALSLYIFPLELYEGFILEHQFNLSKQSFFSWFGDYCKKNAITLFITLIIVEGVYACIHWFYYSWWIYASLLWLAISILFTKVFPLVIMPLFFKSRPLGDGDLARRLHHMAQQFCFKLSDIFIFELSAKTIKANAMVTGLGKSKRIYLSDTLLNDFSHQEIEIIVAHELTHNRNNDLYKHLGVSFVVGMFSFYFCDFFLNRAVHYFGYIAKDDIATLPLFALFIIVASLILLPLQNGFSRRLEKRADIGSIKATNNAHGFVTMISKLGKKNLAEFRPNKAIEFFLYDHPSIAERIRIAKEFLRSTSDTSVLN